VNLLADRALIAWARWSSGILFTFAMLALFRERFDDFTGSEGVSILGFRASPLTSVIHIVVAIAMIAALGSLRGTRRGAALVGVAFTVFGLLEFALGDGSADIFGRNDRMAVLDLGIGVVGVVVWLWSRRHSEAVTVAATGDEPDVNRG